VPVALSTALTVALGTMTHQGLISALEHSRQAMSFVRPDNFSNAHPHCFMFATGSECSAPTIANGRIQRDLLEECGHYDR
jgi:hypothetical protein